MGWTLENIPNLNGKVMIVTGANSGLGFEATRELAKKALRLSWHVEIQRKPKLRNKR